MAASCVGFADERGIALVMTLGILIVLGISATSVAYYTATQGRTTARSENRRDAYSLAEAGMNAALAVLSNALNAKTATSLPACTTPTSMTLDGGTAQYCGVLDTSTYTWSLTATGIAPNPAGGANLTHVLHRTVSVQGISDGASVSAWSRFYSDSTTQCMTVDTVTIPGSVAANHCLILKNGAKITGSTSSVDVGGDLTIIGSPASSSVRPAATGSGWTSSSNIVSSNNSYATASIAASSSSANLDATNFGFSIPSGNIITGITASVERKEASGASAIAVDTSSSAAPSTSTITYDASASGTSASAGTTLAWSHTVANQSNRVLVVGVTAEYSSTSCQATTVTYGSQSMTKITQNVAGSGTYACASLWYLLAPDTGTNTITATYQSSVTNKTAGSVGLYNVKQAAPDASNSSFSNSGATSTNVTTLAANSWVVDVFASGQAVGDLAAAGGQTGRWTRDSGSTESSGMSTKSVATAGSTTMTWTQSGINRSAAVVAAFAPAASASTTLAWSHTVANQSNRVLVVGVNAEHTSSSCQASTVTYGAQSLTKIAQAVAGSGTYECTSLWYLLAPTVGTNTITVTYESSITDTTAGAVGLYNVQQTAPDASNSNYNNAGATSTSLSTVAANSWVVDVFGSGQGLGNLAPGSGQTSRWTKDSGGTQSGGMSTKPVAAIGSTSVTWTQTGINRSAQVAAAFAPTGSDLSDDDVYLLKGGAPVGTDHAGSSGWTTSDATATYGTSTDLWGTTWSLAEVNASDFGLRFKARQSGDGLEHGLGRLRLRHRLLRTAPDLEHRHFRLSGRAGEYQRDVHERRRRRTHALYLRRQRLRLVDHDVRAEPGQADDRPQLLVGKREAGPQAPVHDQLGIGAHVRQQRRLDLRPRPEPHRQRRDDPGDRQLRVPGLGERPARRRALVGQDHARADRQRHDLPRRRLPLRRRRDGRPLPGARDHLRLRRPRVRRAGVLRRLRAPAAASRIHTPARRMQTWDPTQNLLILLTDHNSEYDQGGTSCSPSGTSTCPNGYKPGGFQGIVYANGNCLIHQQFQISGPVMCNTITIPWESDGVPSFYTWPNLGSLIDGQIYVSTGSAEAFEMTLGPTDG